jgi:intein/homing endonuclease
MGVLYSATQNMKEECDFESVLYALQSEESNAKWNVISVIEQLRDIGLFSNAPTPYHELIKSGGCTIINFRGINPDIQDIIVFKLCKDLFELRKQNKLPPFFMVVEEAHNYCVTGDTKILTSKGNKKIKSLNSDNVITFNHNKHQIEEEKNLYKWPERITEVIKLKSVSGRSLKCTPDHSIYDGTKYVEAKNAKYFLIPQVNSYNQETKAIEARLMGAIFSDGWVSTNKQVGFSGKETDLKIIKNDLKTINIKSSNIHSFKNKKSSEITKSTGEKLSVSGSGASIQCSTCAFKRFTKLECLVGEKVTQKTKVPSWILKGSKKIKAEFLAGIMGGDGDVPKARNCNFYAIRMYFSKVEELTDNAKEYAKQIIQLFNDLNVQTKLTTRKGNIRKKDNKKTIKYLISINNKDENLINFFEAIGYRYNTKKELLVKRQPLAYS